MTPIQLDKEEQELLDAYEAGVFCSDMSPSRKAFIEQAATMTFEPKREIVIKLPERDLSALQRRALEAGMPNLSRRYIA